MRIGLWMLTGLAVLVLEMQGAVSCDPIRTFGDGKTPSREVFVSPGGSNSNGDGSREKPYQSIERAVQEVEPGEAVRMLPGNYAGGNYIEGLSGTAEEPIWIGGVPGEERPVIQGGGNGIHFSRVRHLIVENLVIEGATGNGINCDDGGDVSEPGVTSHVVFRQVTFRNIGTGGNNDGLKLSGVYDFFVLDCSFEEVSAGGSGIDHVGCHRGLIARSTFREMGNSIQCKGGSAEIEIRWNRFENGGGRAINIGGSTGFEFFRPPLSMTEPNVESRDIRVLANVFVGSDAPVAFVGTVNSLVANNTFVDPTRWLMRILQETTSSGGYEFLPSGNNRYVNNLVYFRRGALRTDVNIGGNTAPETFEFANNLWYAHDEPNQSRPELPSEEAGGIYGVDPLLKDAGAGDYSIPGESPAVGKGIVLAELKADMVERCYANPPSIGAFEGNPPPGSGADSDGDLLPDEWEDAHALDRNDPADAELDADGDGLRNYGEFVAGTDPNDDGSVFALVEAGVVENGFSFRFPTLAGRRYMVEGSELVASNEWEADEIMTGDGTEMEFKETTESGVRFFRVRIEVE